MAGWIPNRVGGTEVLRKLIPTSRRGKEDEEKEKNARIT